MDSDSDAVQYLFFNSIGARIVWLHTALGAVLRT